MSYTKHNFQRGDELYASQLNEMEDQITLNESNLGNAQSAIGNLNNLETAAKSNLVEAINEAAQSGGGGGGGTNNYNSLINKPQINSVTLSGDMAPRDLGLAAIEDIPDVPVVSVNGQTGNVVLSASDLGAGTYSKPGEGIPKSDFTSAVQASLSRADLAYQKPSSGIPSTDLNSDVQALLEKADTALQTAPVTSVNNLTGDVELTASDVGALPSSTEIHNVPTGGTTSQVLAKRSGTNYDLEWRTVGDGTNGTTFTPAVSSEGIISWTNDGGKTNPSPVNIKGAHGEAGVYYGTTEPTDPDVTVWIDPSGTSETIAAPSSPSDGQVLSYDSTQSEWVAQTLSAEDVTYSNQGEYSSGTVGAKVYELSGMLDYYNSIKANKTTYFDASGASAITTTGNDNVMYLYGELTALTFTAPASGICGIRFTSGTTPTVVTLNGVVMPDSWEGAEANTTYEINILNGYGLVAKWSVSGS